MTVSYWNDNGVARATIDNPPVNVIGAEVRRDLAHALDRAQAEGVDRVILTGAGRCFVAGADAREFGAPPAPPHLPDLVNRIETFPVPCVAAINGAALGGGLEIALACRWRIAAPTATLGLPEVVLGVVPGAGGTQRLPRLIGIAEALAMIWRGKTISARAAEEKGLVESVAEDPVAAAQSLDAELLASCPSLRDRDAPVADPAAAEAARELARQKSAGQEALLRAIELVERSADAPLDEGLRKERETFLSLRDSAQAHALRHVFFAERAAMGQGRKLGADPVETNCAVVVGGGNMGASIAYALARTGVHVTVVEIDGEAADRASGNVRALYDQAVKRGHLTPEAAARERDERVAFAVGYGDLPAAEIAIEAAFEDLNVKQAIFAALDEALPRPAILATNTSYLDVNRIAARVRDPQRVLGLHFFSPAHIMKLLEVVPAAETSAATLATAFRLAQRLGKIPVRAGICDGFIGNRILTRYRQTTDIVLLEGALPGDVDGAMRDFGFAMGPYEVQDLSGLDIAHANRQRLGLRDRADVRHVPIADRMVEEMGRLGRKTRAGWYDYPETSSPAPSPQVEELIRETAQREGVERRAFDPAEIRDRAIAAMVEEACHILEEGVATRPADVDLVMIHGYGFPRWRGGLMHYADTLGLADLLQRLESHAAADLLSWSPSNFLRRLVRDGRTFESLN